MGAIETLIDNVDSIILGFVQGSFGSLTDTIHILWRLMFIVFIAVYGYKILISGRFSASDLFVHCTKIIVLLVIATQWDTFFLIVYNMTTDLPSDIAGQILQGSTNTLGSSAQPGDQASANAGLSEFYDRGMQVVEKMLEGAGFSEIGLFFYAGAVFVGTVAFAGYAGMLIILSKIAVAILLAVGPVFILLLIFTNTRGLFEGWLRTLLNYSVIPIFVYTLLAFLLSLAERPLENLEQQSTTGDGFMNGMAPFCLMSFIAVLLLMQTMNMAASVTGGLSLSTMGSPTWASRKVKGLGMWSWRSTESHRAHLSNATTGKSAQARDYLQKTLKKNKEA
jgi:type IV secretion system protein VirB6